MDGVVSLEAIYPPRFFARRNKLNWRAPIICRAIVEAFSPRTVIDVGCAIGDLVQGFNDIGIQARGIEGSVSAVPFLVCDRELVSIYDLRKPLPAGIPFYTLATCFEVAEHIEPEYADILVQNLVMLSGMLCLSLAPPGQGGHYHVNCQPLEYWEEKFKGHGFRHMPEKEMGIRSKLLVWRNKPGIKAIYLNLACFERIE